MLEQILEKIDKEKKIAEIDLDMVSKRALPYKKGQVMSARERLEKLYVDYKNEVLKRSIFILTTGSDAGAFANIAEEKYKCFTLEAKTMYKEVVKEIDSQLYQGKMANASLFDVVESILEKRLKLLDIVSYNSLMFNSKYQKTIKDEAGMVDLVTNAVNDIIGGEIIGLDALERVSKVAVNKKYKSKIVPILIYSQDEHLISSLSRDIKRVSSKVVTVKAGEAEGKSLNPMVSLEKESIDEESVGEALKKIAENA